MARKLQLDVSIASGMKAAADDSFYRTACRQPQTYGYSCSHAYRDSPDGNSLDSLQEEGGDGSVEAF